MSTDARTNLEPAPPDATPGVRYGRFNAYAAYDEQSEAQEALVALGRAGFEGSAISLSGPEDAVTQDDTRQVDTRIISHWFRNIAIGGAIGAVIGFIAGMPVGAFIIGSIFDRDVTIGNVFRVRLLRCALYQHHPLSGPSSPPSRAAPPGSSHSRSSTAGASSSAYTLTTRMTSAAPSTSAGD